MANMMRSPTYAT